MAKEVTLKKISLVKKLFLLGNAVLRLSVTQINVLIYWQW